MGVRAVAPVLLGVAPFGLIYGALALEAGIRPAAALAMSSIVLAGSAQFVATQLFAASAPGAIIVLTTFVVNLRHLLYSASVAPYLRKLSPLWKTILAYLLTDEAYAVAITHYLQRSSDGSAHDAPRDGAHDLRHWFFLGAGLTLFSTWQASTAVGIYVGGRIPDSWGLSFALPLTFLALARRAITDRPTAVAAVTAGIVAVLADGVALRLGIVVAAAAGLAAGILVGRPAPGPRPR